MKLIRPVSKANYTMAYSSNYPTRYFFRMTCVIGLFSFGHWSQLFLLY